MQGLQHGGVLSSLLFSIFFVAALHVVLVRFSEDEGIVHKLVHLNTDRVGKDEEPLACMRTAVWTIFFANHAGIVSKSAEALAKMMTVTVTIFEASCPSVSKKKTETMRIKARDLVSRDPPFVVEAAGQMYEQEMQFLHLGGVIHADAEFMVDVNRRIRLMRLCYSQFGPGLYDMTTVLLSLTARTLKAEVTENLLYGCVTWTLNKKHYVAVQTAHFVVRP